MPHDPTQPDLVIARAGAGRRYHFPNACRLGDAERTILLLAREGVSHVDPSGRLVLTSSRDNAKTWSVPRVVHDSPGDDRDPMISQSSTGRVFLNWFTSDPGRIGAEIGAYVAYSDDGGRTWSDPLRIGSAMSGTDAAGGTGWAASHGRIAEAPDGTLLAPLYGKLPSDATFSRLSVVRSVDGGLTWPAAGEVFLPTPGPGAAEPVLTVLPDGSVTALIRHDDHPSQLTRSHDNGVTWSPLEPTNLMTSSADTLVLHDGAVFVAFGDQSRRFGERRITAAAVVEDPSRPWRVADAATRPVLDTLVDDQANPSVVEIGPGRLLVFGFDYTARSLVGTYVDREH
ncbi:sialidase family protein [Flindersiella endophytica]